MKRLILAPIMVSLLISIAGLIAIAQSPRNYLQMGIKSSQLSARLDKPHAVKVAQTPREIGDKKALNLVWKLPQVQRKAREIQRLSRGTIKVAAIVDSSPTPSEPYYKVRVYEDEPDHNTTIYWFRVLNPSGVIEVLDILENKYISLEEWKEQLNNS
ncbi:MAG: hypothetical protein KME21_04675 [Desmonostoc vinosum HA7617-LM4]|jgi:hypothetical protein|nr:hypothetical protein [Desmonostoc vinosum HA7617-LM4]